MSLNQINAQKGLFIKAISDILEHGDLSDI